jgi:hypothetical protein
MPSVRATGSLTRFREASWARVVQAGLGVLIIVSLAKIVFTDPNARMLLRIVAAASFFGSLAFKYALELPDGLRRGAARRRAGASLRAWLAETQPEELRGWMRLHRAQGKAFLAWAFRRPLPASPPGQGIGYLRRSSYPTLVIIVLLGACIEMPVLYLLVGAQQLPHSTIMALHSAIAGLTCASVAWVLGDRYLLGAGHHLVTANELVLNLGARCVGRIPLGAIASCRVLSRRGPNGDETKVSPATDLLVVSPFDRPNVEISLAESNVVVVTHLQRRRAGIRRLVLYVDDPSGFAVALRRGQQSSFEAPI